MVRLLIEITESRYPIAIPDYDTLQVDLNYDIMILLEQDALQNLFQVVKA